MSGRDVWYILFPFHDGFRSLGKNRRRKEISTAKSVVFPTKYNSTSSKFFALASTVAANWRARFSLKIRDIVRHLCISFENTLKILEMCAWFSGSRASCEKGGPRCRERGRLPERASQISANLGCRAWGTANEHHNKGTDRAISLQ